MATITVSVQLVPTSLNKIWECLRREISQQSIIKAEIINPKRKIILAYNKRLSSTEVPGIWVFCLVLHCECICFYYMHTLFC